MKKVDNPPYAPNLIESMRSIGYSFNTALADIIDNSITAQATLIKVLSSVEKDDTFVAVVDNGIGMSKDELLTAMKYGSHNPNEKREKQDLGRFGIGLKSASLSQCRKLTVISKKNGNYSGYIWDIDFIVENGKWSIQELEIEEINNIEIVCEITKYKTGTIVIWERFDHLKKTNMDLKSAIKEQIVNSIDHFSLIYHRLLGKKLMITVNGNQVLPKDPFLENHNATQLKREQKIVVDNKIITLKPYILPHISKLSNEDIIKIGGKESLKTKQGFYIYRNKRLIIWGTWFRLTYKNELSKLARVKVDIPNDMDYLWDIDIKKSNASLPDKIKSSLYNAVLESCSISEKVHVYKGKKAMHDNLIHMWNIIEKRKGDGLGLEINMDNAIIVTFLNTLNNSQKKAFKAIIDDVENMLPINYIYMQVAQGASKEEERSQKEKDKEFENIISKMNIFMDIGMSKDEVIEWLLNHEKYANDSYISEKLLNMKG